MEKFEKRVLFVLVILSFVLSFVLFYIFLNNDTRVRKLENENIEIKQNINMLKYAFEHEMTVDTVIVNINNYKK